MIKQWVSRMLPARARMRLQAADHYLRGEPELRLLSLVCDPERAAVDVGANIGVYTYFLRRYAARVHAYEPHPSLAQQLERLFPDVTVRNAAVSNACGTVTLKVPMVGDRLNHERASISADLTEDGPIRELPVEAVTLDSEGLVDVGFLKIDVEQHEREVLQGALQLVQASRPVIMTEATPLLYPEGLVAAFSFITDLAYVGWFRFEGQFLPFSRFVPAVHANAERWSTSFMGNNVFFFPAESPFASRFPPS